MAMHSQTQRESENLLRRHQALMKNSFDGIVVMNLQGDVLEANDAFCRLLGYPLEETLKLNVADWDVQWTKEELREVIRSFIGKSGSTFVTVQRRKDGTRINVEVSNTAIEIDGEYYFFSSCRDITGRKQAEEVLLKTNQRLELAQKTSRSGVWEWNMTTDHFDWSLELFRIFGLDAEKDVAGIEIWLAILHPEDAEVAAKRFERAVQDGTLLDIEFRIVRRDGKVRWINTLGQTTYDETKQQSLMTGICIDITERKQAEETVQKSEERARLILETLSEAVALNEIVFNEEGEMIDYRVLEVNDAFYKIADYRKGIPVIGQTASELYGMDVEAIKVFLESHKNSVETLHTEIISPINKIIFSISTSPFKNNRFVTSFHDITEIKKATAEIERLAYHDALTGLSNRQLLLDRLHQALVSCARNNRAGALLFIDLDNFKSLNDTLGHETGDLLLQLVSQRLKSCIREVDTLARLGGDEFVVMLLDLGEQPIEAAAQSEIIGEKILAAISLPYQLDTHEYHCTASIGVTLFNNDQQGTEELMKQADIAMYQAKKTGRNALRFFDNQMQESISARVLLESELRKAIELGQFQLHYQIQVDSLRRPLGAEAVIRWLHPERRQVSPSQFIPLAEETGLILPIGQWVIETACAQIKSWEQNANTRKLVLAVNVSARQFHQAEFAIQVQAAINRHAIDPKLLKLELTEGMLLEDIEGTITTMNALNEIGVQISLDDFGTGYSSLQYLKLLPVDQLKIDMSFVRDIATDRNDKAIVRTIIAMAQSLDMDVIAEGVETEEQCQLLLKNGCTHFQGYFFGKPIPIDQFEVHL